MVGRGGGEAQGVADPKKGQPCLQRYRVRVKKVVNLKSIEGPFPKHLF
jgi:uncharacterized protein (DUF433 family)